MFESFADVKVNFQAQKYGYIGLSLMIVLGLIASSFTVVESALASEKTVGISETFGESRGISNVVKTSQEALPGLPSTTVSFDLANRPQQNEPLSAFSWVNTFLSEDYTEADIINIDATVVDETYKDVKVQFFATSNMDYTDGTFSKVTAGLRGILSNSKLTKLHIVSTPTEDGARSLNVEALTPTSGTKIAEVNQEKAVLNLSGNWHDFITPFSRFSPDGNRINYSYTLEGARPITLNGFVYDEASLETVKNLDTGIFNTLYKWATFSPGGSFTPVSMNFTPSINGAESAAENILLITLAGAQPEDPNTFNDELNTLIDKATQNGLLPSSTTVAFQFEENDTPAHVITP